MMRRLQIARSCCARVARNRPVSRPIFSPLHHIFRSQSTAVAADALSSDSLQPDDDTIDLSQSPLLHPVPASSNTSEDFEPPVPSADSARLSALHARLLLPKKFPLLTLSRCLIDRTANSTAWQNNASLSVLGADLLAYWTSESIICHFPRLPIAVIQAAMSAYVGEAALALLCKEWGVEQAAFPGPEVDPGYLQFKAVEPGVELDPDRKGIPMEPRGYSFGTKRQGLSSTVIYKDEFGDAIRLPSRRPKPDGSPSEGFPANATLHEAQASFARAVFGALYLHTGRASCRSFFRAHVLSRQLDMKKLFGFELPGRELSRLCAREGFEPPVARLLAETGRTSRHPAFVVGVYSGKDKLGEGTGAGLDEARTRAAANALKSWYLYQPLDVRVPSDMEDPTGRETRWTPVMIDGGEVVS